MTDFEKYTVAWISALPIEGAAGELFFDEEHEGPASQPVGDSNIYSLGRIGSHNVVLVTMPKHRPGVEVAAVTARNLGRTFPNVRISLLVGVGGGVPLVHDIRLGDIVVSSHDKDKGGVVQYARGKSLQDQDFEDAAHMNSPPELLLNAVAALQKRYLRQGHTIVEDMEKALENVKKKRTFRRPSLETDRLFEASYVHPVSTDSCSGCNECHLIPRSPRDEEDNDPEIHYGLIGSSSILRKNAIERDALAKRDGIMCFEMEAAGLMNHFPCLVIRGICDYCDSHKNKDWQGYAAMTAAAYARALLSIIPPAQVESEAKIQVVIRDELSKLSDKFCDVTTAVEKLSQYSHDEETMKILNWLTPVNYGTQQSDVLSRRTKGTGLWLLESKEYQQWLETPGATMFCPGIPGAGKTVLTSIAVQDLMTRFPLSNAQYSVVYIYCNFKRKDEQDLSHLFQSILRQLGQKLVALPTCIRDLYDRHRQRGTRASVDELISCIEVIATEGARVYLLVDALDECSLSNGRRDEFLTAIRQLQENAKINFFATSRHHPEIIAKFSGSLRLDIRAQDSDIQAFLHSGMAELIAVTKGKPDLQDELVGQLTKATDGMFLLAQLHLQSLIGKTNLKSIRLAVKQLSQSSGEKKYNHAYQETMDRIEGQHPDQVACAKKVLMWITFAQRPLETAELQEAIGVELHTSCLDKDVLTPLEIMVSVCAGLVIVDSDSDIIRLVHYTTQDYLVETQSHWFPHAQRDIVLACTTYLSFDAFSSGPAGCKRSFTIRLREHIFFHYAAANWGYHAQEAGEPTDVDLFLKSPAHVEAASELLVREIYDYDFEAGKGRTALHLAAHFGLVKTIDRLILSANDFDINAKDFNRHTPLSWATQAEQVAVLKQLLAMENLDVNSQDMFGYTPLASAAEKGDQKVLKLLLSRKDIDVNGTNNQPLLGAVQRGDEVIVKILLSAPGVNPLTWDDYGYTLMHEAASKGQLGVLKLLLTVPGVNVNAETYAGETPFMLALKRDRKEVAEYLLTVQGVVTYTKDTRGYTTLHHAAGRGYTSVVEVLAAQGVDINVKGYYGGTPLGAAAETGESAMVGLLLSMRDVNVNATDDCNRTALSYAASYGHVLVVKKLLSVAGIAVNAASTDNQTPLFFAAKNGHISVVRQLLGVIGIRVDVKDRFGKDAFTCAAREGHKDIVEVLISHNAKRANGKPMGNLH